MSHREMRVRVPRSFHLAVIPLVGLLLLGGLLGAAPPAAAQGVGIFSRTDCTTLTSPVTGQTFCFDQTANQLKVWNGTAWVLDTRVDAYTKAGLPVAGTAGRLARVTDNVRGLWMDTGTQWEKVLPEVDARDFGVLADGTTDDITALNAATVQAIASGLPLRLPAGTIVLTESWTIDGTASAKKIHVIGAGPQITVILNKASASKPTLNLLGSSPVLSAFVGSIFENFRIDGHASFPNNAVYLQNITWTTFRNLVLTPNGHGMVLDNTTIINRFENIDVWPVGYTNVGSTLLVDKDGFQLTAAGAKDGNHFLRSTVYSGRYGVMSLATSLTGTVFDMFIPVTTWIPGGTYDGRSSAIGASTLTDAAQAWTANQVKDFLVTIVNGTGAGQTRRITSHTGTVLTVTPPWDTADLPVALAYYQISGAGMAFFGGEAGVSIRDLYAEGTPGGNVTGVPAVPAANAHAVGDVAVYLAEGATDVKLDGTFATGAVIFAHDPAASGNSIGNVITGGLGIDRIRIDTGVSRTTLLNTRRGVQGTGAFYQDNGTRTTRLNTSSYGVSNDGTQRFAWEWDEPTATTGGDTTPSVKGIKTLILNNAGATSITTFDDGITGQLLTVRASNGNTTLVNGATLVLVGGINWTMPTNATAQFILLGTIWYQLAPGSSQGLHLSLGQALRGRDSLATTEKLAFLSATSNVGIYRGGQTGSIAVDGTLTLRGTSDAIGLLVVTGGTSDAVAVFVISGTTITELSDPGGVFSTTQGTATSTNVYTSGGNVVIENKTAGAKNYTIQLLGGTETP